MDGICKLCPGIDWLIALPFIPDKVHLLQCTDDLINRIFIIPKVV